ncbi:amidase signature domain-containing protein [Chytriomyces sp. MP71]|nr:amidase signature domain-containing protein [Chytriomyces sp. MP71]
MALPVASLLRVTTWASLQFCFEDTLFSLKPCRNNTTRWLDVLCGHALLGLGLLERVVKEATVTVRRLAKRIEFAQWTKRRWMGRTDRQSRDQKMQSGRDHVMDQRGVRFARFVPVPVPAVIELRMKLEILEATVAALRAALDGEQLTSVELTQFYLDRIEALNHDGPGLHAVIETNPDALALAAAADSERSSMLSSGGRVPPLHGIPVLVKDNVATLDAMQTSAGSWVLVGSQVPRDAFAVARLRKAGAVLLGKANLSQWSNWRTGQTAPNGWSSRGGQTRNPFDLAGEVSGSSSGSAVAASANLAAITIGSETDGSIVCPAKLNGVVGIKPTVGLVSRSGVIPISHTQDSLGPITRTVADAAAVLDAIIGPDERDALSVTINANRPSLQPYTSLLDANPRALQGLRIGFAVKLGNEASQNAVKVLEQLGATVVEIEFPDVGGYPNDGNELTILRFDFKQDINTYLSELTNTKIKTLDDIIAAAAADSRENIYPSPEHEQSNATTDPSDPVYQTALAVQLRDSREAGIDLVLARDKLDAILGDPDLLCGPSAMAGYPVISVPAPSPEWKPRAVGFMGGAYSDGVLLKCAYAYEQATKARKMPEFHTVVKTVTTTKSILKSQSQTKSGESKSLITTRTITTTSYEPISFIELSLMCHLRDGSSSDLRNDWHQKSSR